MLLCENANKKGISTKRNKVCTNAKYNRSNAKQIEHSAMPIEPIAKPIEPIAWIIRGGAEHIEKSALLVNGSELHNIGIVSTIEEDAVN